MTLSAVLARELAAARPRFNADVAAARRGRVGFDTDALNDALRIRIDPLAVAVDAVAPARTAAVVEVAFALNVVLVDQALSGERRALVDRAWTRAAVPLAAVIAERPERALAMITNAVLTLFATRGARPDEWLDRMAALALHVTSNTLGAVGQVVAWRSGMAHYRAGALALADELPESLALLALGVTTPGSSWRKVRANLAASRWWKPDTDGTAAGNGVDTGIRFGGFVGFGGPFESPPEVRAAAQDFMVRGGRKIGLLIADAFGATLHPATEDEFNQASPSFSARVAVSGFPDEGLQTAVAGDSIAIISPYSHVIVVRPLRS